MTSCASFFSKKLQFINMYIDNIWAKEMNIKVTSFLSEWGSLWNIVLYNKAKQVSQTVMGILPEILITDSQEFLKMSQSFSW